MSGSPPKKDQTDPLDRMASKDKSDTEDQSNSGDKLASNLRFGWTTGTCATAAVNAAYTAMITGQFPDRVTIITPSGKNADLEVVETAQGAAIAGTSDDSDDRRWFRAGIIKDAGDDPDVTHGALILATLRALPAKSGTCFRGGEGVGVVTKPGLPIAVGEPAINPVPRRMMSEAIEQLAQKLNGPTDIEIEISVPGGQALALKTWNPRLGIEGGISILGTTGVVRPFSCSAWIASIHRGIDVARANALPHVMGSTGATSEAWGKAHYGLPDIALLDMGDFVGGMLKYMRRNKVPNLSIMGGMGKLVKLSQGAVDLHSARSQVDFTALAEVAAPFGFDPVKVGAANTVLEVLQMASPDQRAGLAARVAAGARTKALEHLRHNDTALEVVVISREGEMLGRAGKVERPAQ
ncbi:cobalt-precorrin-5B (C(1))-methyltransferase [Alphaproteobacteria bacterium]|nr:cobalt-precorrin-5B (C(1))-methyltransferase [Alphaproteobacteria bacterium]